MNETFELLKKINWILEPIADFIIFLFTTTGGLVLFSLLFAIFLIISIANAFYERKLMHGTGGGFLGGKLSVVEKTYLTGRVIGQTFLKLITNIPLLFGVFVFLLFTVGVSKALSSYEDFMMQQQKVKELKTIVKQLDQRYKVADIEVIDQVYSIDKKSYTTTLELKFYDYSNSGIDIPKQKIIIKGNDIYVDALVINFEYSEISESGVKNLTIPYRIFSNEVAQKDAIKLDIKNEKDIPFIFLRKEEEIYGVEPTTFNTGLQEILGYINDKEKAQKAGIRSIYGNAVHKRVWKGSKETIWVEQTGGIILKAASNF